MFKVWSQFHIYSLFTHTKKNVDFEIPNLSLPRTLKLFKKGEKNVS